jgi:hypothetical protein
MFIFLFFDKRTIDRLKMVQYLSVLKKYMQLQVPLPVKLSEKQNHQLSGAKATIVSGHYSNIN